MPQSQCCTTRDATMRGLPTTPKNSLAPRSVTTEKPKQQQRPSTAPNQSILKKKKNRVISSPSSLALVLKSWGICPRPLPSASASIPAQHFLRSCSGLLAHLLALTLFPPSIPHVSLSITFKNATVTVQHLKLLTLASQVLARRGSILS